MSKKLATLILLTPLVGCMQFKPVGILSDPNAEIARIAEERRQMAEQAANLAEANKPPTPTHRISAQDITTENRYQSLQKLREEIDQDLKDVEKFPRYTTMSKVER
jgi:hypothetical protein